MDDAYLISIIREKKIHLSSRNRQLILSRFDKDGKSKNTFRQIAVHYDISIPRVREIIKRGLSLARTYKKTHNNITPSASSGKKPIGEQGILEFIFNKNQNEYIPNLSARVCNCLLRAGAKKVKDIQKISSVDLLALQGCGEKTLQATIYILGRHGLSLRKNFFNP